MSKKDLAKAAKKDAKSSAKEAVKSGEPIVGKDVPIIPKPAKGKPPVQSNFSTSANDAVGAHVDALEARLGTSMWFGGKEPS